MPIFQSPVLGDSSMKSSGDRRSPYFLRRPRFPVRSGGRSYMTVSILTLQMMSRFRYSSTRPATHLLDTSCRIAGIPICLNRRCPSHGGSFQRQFPASSVFYPKAGIQVGQTDNVWNHLREPGMTAGCLPYSAH